MVKSLALRRRMLPKEICYYGSTMKCQMTTKQNGFSQNQNEWPKESYGMSGK